MARNRPSTAGADLVVVLYLPRTRELPVDLPDRWEEIVASATAIEEYSAEGGTAQIGPAWAVVKCDGARAGAIVAGFGGLTGEDLQSALGTSGINDVDEPGG